MINEDLAKRIQLYLGGRSGWETRNMFGGVGYLLHGNMAFGIYREYLIVRIGVEAFDNAAKNPHTKAFDITGKPMRGWVMVSPAGYVGETELTQWLRLGDSFAESLPPKTTTHD